MVHFFFVTYRHQLSLHLDERQFAFLGVVPTVYFVRRGRPQRHIEALT